MKNLILSLIFLVVAVFASIYLLLQLVFEGVVALAWTPIYSFCLFWYKVTKDFPEIINQMAQARELRVELMRQTQEDSGNFWEDYAARLDKRKQERIANAQPLNNNSTKTEE
jgi:hypothetical protein